MITQLAYFIIHFTVFEYLNIFRGYVDFLVLQVVSCHHSSCHQQLFASYQMTYVYHKELTIYAC